MQEESLNENPIPKEMSKLSAIIQLIVIILIVGYSTYQLFKGNLDRSLALLPLLMVYYIFITARKKKTQSQEKTPGSKTQP